MEEKTEKLNTEETSLKAAMAAELIVSLELESF